MRPGRALLALAGLVALSSCAHEDATRPLPPEFVVHDDRFHDFVDAYAPIDVLVDELGWAEGPVWVGGLDALLFSDVAADAIYRWDAASGVGVFLSPSGHAPDDGGTAWRGSNGLAIDRDGTLLLAQQSNRTLARMAASLREPVAAFESLASSYEGKRLNSPNDLVVHRSGSIFFTDPPYGLVGFEKSPDRELAFFGVFRLTKTEELSLVTPDIERPNGIALSPDEATLYVSNSLEGKARIFAIELAQDGTPGSARLFYDAAELIPDGPGTTDGMAVHPSGHLFATIPNGIGLLSPDGRLLGKIALGQVTNVALDQSASYLFVTAPDRLLRLRLKADR